MLPYNIPNLSLRTPLDPHLLHRSSIDRIANSPCGFDLQNRRFRIDHTNQILDKPPIDHRSDLGWASCRHITHNPDDIFLLQLFRLRQNRNQHLQQPCIEHQLRVFTVSRHDVPCHAQRRTLQPNVVHIDQSHEVRRVHERNHSLLLCRFGVQ